MVVVVDVVVTILQVATMERYCVAFGCSVL